jgi:hypothetical protein
VVGLRQPLRHGTRNSVIQRATLGENLALFFWGPGDGRSFKKTDRQEKSFQVPSNKSFAHGRGLYQLRHDARSAKAIIAQAPANAAVDYAMATLAATDLEVDELADFAATVSSVAKVGIRVVMARINKERRERETAKRKAMMASSADGRIVRPRPEPDGELLPTVRFLDEILASDKREEPPMRDAAGNLVEVRVREPWALHLLTADGTNAAAEGGQAMKAPSEPVLVQLTPTGIELLVERYVRWWVQKKNTCYFGALPRPFIDGLREYHRIGAQMQVPQHMAS